MITFKCPGCGADLHYDITKESMKCDNCDKEITLDYYRSKLDEQGYFLGYEHDCPQCGATLITTDVTGATFCSYCGSTMVLNETMREGKKPDTISPFRITMQDAFDIYRERIDRSLLAPEWMKGSGLTEKLHGIYLPYYLLRYKYYGTYQGRGTHFHRQFIKGVEYDVREEYEVDTYINANYNFIPVDAASALPDNISRAISPYDKNRIYTFKPEYLAGYYADLSDVDADVYTHNYKAQVYNDMASKPCTLNGIDLDRNVVDGVELEEEVSKTMFPVWLLTMRNRDKISYAAINGQNGNIAVDIPIDMKKFLKLSVFIAGIFSVVLNFFFTLQPTDVLLFTSIVSFILILIASRTMNDTYNTKHHLNDPGYSSEVEPKEPVKRRLKGGWRIFVTTILALLFIPASFCLALGILMFFDLNEELFGLVMLMFIGLSIYLIVRLVDKGVYRVRNPKAPILYRLSATIFPIVNIIAAIVVRSSYPNNDDICYMTGAVAILFIILTAFRVVIEYNRMTMRDLPIFTQVRGGDNV